MKIIFHRKIQKYIRFRKQKKYKNKFSKKKISAQNDAQKFLIMNIQIFVPKNNFLIGWEDFSDSEEENNVETKINEKEEQCEKNIKKLFNFIQ